MSPSATLNNVLLFPVFSDLGFWGFNRIRKFKQNVESLVFITDFAFCCYQRVLSHFSLLLSPLLEVLSFSPLLLSKSSALLS